MDKPAAEQTEQPTARRLQRSRSQGQVPHSQELPAFLVIIALMLVLWLTGEDIIAWTHNEIIVCFNTNHAVFAGQTAFLDFATKRLASLAAILMPIFIAVIAASITGCVAVSGLNFAPASLKPQLGNLNPIKGFGNFFSSRSLVTLIISIVKLIILSIVAYVYLKDKIYELPMLRWLSAPEILASISQLIFGVLIRLAIAICIIAVADVIYQKWKYIHDMKMTRQEVKQERKEDEGSPDIKRKIRMLQIELASKRMLQEVPKANLILVNPTHVAVAIKYDAAKMTAPMVLAKGGDNLCEKIKEIARANGIPIIHRPELARAIFKTVEPGNPIPEALYVAVAEVLALIYRLRKHL